MILINYIFFSVINSLLINLIVSFYSYQFQGKRATVATGKQEIGITHVVKAIPL